MFRKIGFIGTGVMGGAVASLAAAGDPSAALYLANRSTEKAAALAEELPGAVLSFNEEIAAVCDLIFLAVKPQVMPHVLPSLAPVLAERQDRFVLVTMAAGLTCDTIRRLAGGDYPVIRMMPNTPITVGEGAIQYCGLGVSSGDLDAFASLLKGAGTVDEIPEALMDVSSALSGCGPAFVCQFIEALADGGVACGLPRSLALELAAATLSGSATLMLETGKHPAQLKDEVCSPGGTTIQGVRALEKGGLRSAVMEAVIAAYHK